MQFILQKGAEQSVMLEAGHDVGTISGFYKRIQAPKGQSYVKGQTLDIPVSKGITGHDQRTVVLQQVSGIIKRFLRVAETVCAQMSQRTEGLKSFQGPHDDQIVSGGGGFQKLSRVRKYPSDLWRCKRLIRM